MIHLEIFQFQFAGCDLAQSDVENVGLIKHPSNNITMKPNFYAHYLLQNKTKISLKIWIFLSFHMQSKEGSLLLIINDKLQCIGFLYKIPLIEAYFRHMQHNIIGSILQVVQYRRSTIKCATQYYLINILANTNMMVTVILALLVLFAVWIAYKYYYLPKKEIRRYKELLQKLGYKVYIRPFKFLGVGIFSEEKIAEVLYKDALYYEKSKYVGYDINISNALDKVWINLVNPELIKEFLSAQTNAHFPKLQLLVRGFKQAMGPGLVFTQGKVWKHKRKIISKAFNFQLLQENIPNIIEICDSCFDQFDEKFKTSSTEVKYNVLNLSAKMFNRVMLKCFFGCDKVDAVIKGKSFDEFIIHLIDDVIRLTYSPLILFFGMFPYNYGLTKRIRTVKEEIAIFRGISHQIIQKRQKQIENLQKKQKTSDIIQSLVYENTEAQKNHEKLQYSHEDLINEFAAFIVAGTDTTSRFFLMMIYYICQNSEIQRKLRQNINENIRSNSDITYENLKKLIYIDWIQNQTTRFYGPGTEIIPRLSDSDCFIQNIPITKGTILNFYSVTSHYNQEYYKDPQTFRPQRWQKECESNHPYALTGFSGGARSCLGKHLALLQSKIALVKLIKRYEKMSIPNYELCLVKNFKYEPTPFQTLFTK